MGAILGITDRFTVMLDLDNIKFKDAKRLCILACVWYKLEGFVLLRSSRNHYHVIFNKPMKSWRKTVNIISRIAVKTKNPEVYKWVLMQIIKKASTLRISHKGNKPIPKIVYSYGKLDKQVKAFLSVRNDVIRFLLKDLLDSRVFVDADHASVVKP